jgi:hypothetical protein
MNADSEFAGWLADYRHKRLHVACGPCSRQGDYKVSSLRMMLGNPPMDEVPRLLAIKAGCALATKFPGRDCRACFLSHRTPEIVRDLGGARHSGWQLVLTCGRRHQGLKSVKPCRAPFYLDLPSLVATLGHEYPIEQLRRRLICPGCGSPHFELHWIAPKAPPVEPIPLRKAG